MSWILQLNLGITISESVTQCDVGSEKIGTSRAIDVAIVNVASGLGTDAKIDVGWANPRLKFLSEIGNVVANKEVVWLQKQRMKKAKSGRVSWCLRMLVWGAVVVVRVLLPCQSKWYQARKESELSRWRMFGRAMMMNRSIQRIVMSKWCVYLNAHHIRVSTENIINHTRFRGRRV